MKKLSLFLLIGVFLILMTGLAYSGIQSIYSGSNAGSGGVVVSNSANADGSTTGNTASAVDDNNHWSADGAVWTFTMDDSNSAEIINVSLYLRHFQSGHSNDGFNIDVYDGSTWTTVQSYDGATSPPTSDTTDNWNVSTILNTLTKINAAQVRIIGTGKSGGHDAVTWNVDTVELKVQNPIVLTTFPVNNTNSSTAAVVFSGICTDSQLDYCVLYGNWSDGTTENWHANQTNSSPVSGSQTNFTVNLNTDAKYTFTYWYNDTSGTSAFAPNRTLTVDSTNPVSALGINRVDNFNSSSNTPTFDFKASDNLEIIKSIQLFGNWSGGWKSNYTNTSYGDNDYLNITTTAIPDGKYIWGVRSNDSAGNSHFSANRTITIDTTNPSVTLNNPVNTKNVTTTAVTFSGTIIDANIEYVRLYLNHTGTADVWAINGTNSSAISGSQVNFTRNLPDGKYLWNYWANDSSGNEIFGTSNRTFTVDSINPSSSFGINPVDTLNQSSSTAVFDFKASDNLGTVEYVRLYGNWTGGWHANYTNTSYDSGDYLNISVANIPDGKYVWGVFSNDSAGHINWTSTNRTITIDTTNPLVNYVSPTENNNSNVSRTWVYVNASYIEENPVNITFRIYNSTGTWNSTTYLTPSNTTNVTINFTGLAEGTYNFNFTVVDILSNSNTSIPIRTALDTTNPGVVLDFPTNNTVNNTYYNLLNTTVTDNRNQIIVKIYGGNETSFFNNDSLIYKRENVDSGKVVSYNWSSPVMNVTSDTVLLMHFDLEEHDNETFVFDETKVNNGTKLASGEPAWNKTEAKFGYSLGFDGTNDYVTIPDSNSLDLTGNFSISFWAYPKDLTKNQTFLSKGSGTTATNYFIDYTTNNEIEFGFYNGGFRTITVDASDVTLNKWNLITTTWNETGNISKIYINGVEKGSLQLNFDIVANTLDLKLGHFPGYSQNYTGLMDELIMYNKILTPTEVINMYKLKESDWYWRVDLNDTASNVNVSGTRLFTIGKIWTINPTSFGSVGVALNVNASLNLTINNTNSNTNNNISITITSNYTGSSYYNTTFPILLEANTSGAGNVTNVHINVTSPGTDGITPILFNVTVTNKDTGDRSVPYYQMVRTDIVHTSSNPLLISSFASSPSIVSQNNTGINLIGSIENLGQGIAENVILKFVLPSGWSNSSGKLTRNVGTLSVGAENNYSLGVDIASDAPTGSVVLNIGAIGENTTGVNLNATYINNGTATVTVNGVSAGAGPATTTTTATTSTTGGGGGSGSASSGGSISGGVISKGIEIVRGSNDISFDISVKARYVNTTLQNLTLSLIGFPEQYVSVTPRVIDMIKYGETKNFTITLNAPSYAAYEEHNLTIIVKGDLVRNTGKKSKYSDTHKIKLIIQETSLDSASISLKKAEKAILEMKSFGFNTQEVERLLKQARSKLSEKRNQEANILANKIIKIKNKAFEINNLINNLEEVLKNPRKISLITGNVAKDILDEEGAIVSSNSIITGNAIFGSQSAQDVIALAKAAFERGDYDLAEERAKAAQVLLILERKGNFGLFLYLYWRLIILGMFIFSAGGILGYRKYQKSSVTKKIENINKEEENIRVLTQSSQKNYFEGKTSEEEYHRIMAQNQDKLGKLKKLRITLRNKRIRMLKPQQISQDLEIEKLEVESLIKSIQQEYYVNKSISENDYKSQFENLNGRLAEIEGEKVTLDFLKEKNKNQNLENKSKKIKNNNSKDEEIEKEFKVAELEAKEKIKKEGKTRVAYFKILRILEKPFNYFKKKKSNKEINKIIKKKSKERIKAKTNFVEFKYRITGFLKRQFNRVFTKRNKKGVVLMDSSVLEKIKAESKKVDCKGKWIHVKSSKSKSNRMEDENEK